jgi:hypothetical protein
MMNMTNNLKGVDALPGGRAGDESHDSGKAPAVSGGRVVVLWVSRHEPVPAQLEALKQRLGGNVLVVKLQQAVPNAEYVLARAKEVGAKYLVPVLPLSMIALLAEHAPREGITVLFSRMKVVAEAHKDDRDALQRLFELYREKPEARTVVEYSDRLRLFEFERFEVVRKVELVTEPW